MGYVDIGAQSEGGSIVDTLSAVALPTHSEGDLLVVFATQHNGSTDTCSVSGYTQKAFHESSSGGSYKAITVFAKTAGASETAPDVVWSGTPGGNVTAQIASFSDVHADVEDAADVGSDNTSAENPFTPTGITTNTDGAIVLSIVATIDNNALALDTDQGFTLQAGGADYDSTSGSDASFGLATKAVATAGAVTVPTWSQTVNGDDPWVAITMALKPAGGATQTLTGALFSKAPTFPTGAVDASNVLVGVLFEKGFTTPNLLTAPNDGDGAGVTGAADVAQSFIGIGTLSTATLWLYAVGSPADSYYLELVTVLDGTPVATSDLVDASSVPGIPGARTEFAFSTAPTLSAGNRYYLVLKRDGGTDVSNYLAWIGSNVTDNYPVGNAWAHIGGEWDYLGGDPDWDLYAELDAIPGGIVSVDEVLTGTLFEAAPTFPTGDLTQSTILAGVLFTQTPLFPTGQIDLTVLGALFANTPAFPAGSAIVTQTLTGTLFQSTPTFPAGTAELGLVGAVFQNNPLFPAGQIDLTVLGTLFTPTVGFPVGAISTPSVQTLTGTLYANTPVFPTGLIVAVVDTLTGVLFTPTVSFPTGALIGVQTLTGTLFQNAPAFGAGTLTGSNLLTGAVFQNTPIFPTGQIDLTVLGSLFVPVVVFPTGQIIVPGIDYQWYVDLIEQIWETTLRGGMWVARNPT